MDHTLNTDHSLPQYPATLFLVTGDVSRPANSHDSTVCHTIFVHFSQSHDMTQLSHDFNFLLNFLQLIQVEHVKTFDIKVLNSFSIVLIHV